MPAPNATAPDAAWADTQAEPAAQRDGRSERVDLAWRAYQWQAYVDNLPFAVLGGLLGGLLLSYLVGDAVLGRWLTVWQGALALCLVVRGALWWRQRAVADGAHPGAAPAALRSHRFGVVLQAMVWAAACWLPLPAGDPVPEALRTLVIVAIVGGSVFMLSFDLAYAGLFGGLVQGAHSLRLLQSDTPEMTTLAFSGLVALGFFGLAAVRSGRTARRLVALQHVSATQRQALADSQSALAAKSDLLQLTLESITQGIANVDAQGHVRAFNQRARELLDLPAAVLREGASFSQIRDFQQQRGDLGDGLGIDADGQPRALPTTVAEAPPVYVRRTRAGRMLEVNTRLLPQGGLVRTYADVTDYFEAQQALKAAKEEAERASQAKSHFLSGMSHELRTPLNAILGFGQVLLADHRDPLHPRHRQPVVEVLNAAQHLLQLINDLLDLSVLESGRLQVSLVPVPLEGVVDSALALVRPLAQDAGVQMGDGLWCDGAPGDLAPREAHGATVWADRTRLQQVLLNLLANAVKYNQRGGWVRVGAGHRPAEDGRPACLRITVQDNGPGLDAAQCARLFTPFERLGAVRSAHAGAGLGLALSRGLAHAMGGDMGVVSQRGQGSKFWIDLPAGPVVPALDEPPALGADAALVAHLPPLFHGHDTVLYVEDNPVNALLMESMLDRLGRPLLVVAVNARDGLAQAIALRPQLILLDIELPDMNGVALLRQLRALPTCAHTPIVAVSANALPADVAQGLSAGFTHYLTKPVSLHQLRSALAASLKPEQAVA